MRRQVRSIKASRARPRGRTGPFYGWVPDLPDHRDFSYEPARKFLRALPGRVDLTKHCPPVYRQGRLQSCAANAIAAALQFDKMKQPRPENFMPSRLFIYYHQRALEHTIQSNSAVQIRHGIKTVAKRGVCHERSWPYRQEKFRQKPPHQCETEAAQYPDVTYHRIRRALPQMKACLASGHPFIFGFTVYDSFHSKKVTQTGRAAMPARGDKLRGGHAALVVGYEEAQRRFIVRNSWGRKWGRRGYFTLPYDYFTQHSLSQDFWTIRVLSGR